MNPASQSGPPLSPCVRVCRMDETRRWCLGCGRTLDEIAGWWGMSDAEKRRVLAALPERLAGGDRQ